jgi:hypothetical protein
MSFVFRMFTASGIALVSAVLGCSPGGPKIVLVTGSVTLFGERVYDV